MIPLNSHPEPLPLALPAANPSSRARAVAGLQLADAALLQFNYHLHDVHRTAPSVDAGQFADLASWLATLPAETAQATIALRLARAESLRRMLDDPDWNLPADLRERAVHLLDYLYRFDDLIPDDLPVIGHLDDALLIELSWSEFEGEVRDYEDFRRFCGENRVRGNGEERRSAWESECLAQASAMLHRLNVRERGYARQEPLSRPFRVC
jgi:uncharacterized membrane protein YkvA (DUF1232 family)